MTLTLHCCHAHAAMRLLPPPPLLVLCPPCRDFAITRCRDMWVCLKNLTAGFWQKSAAALCRDLGAADLILGLIFRVPAVTHPGSGLKAAAVTTCQPQARNSPKPNRNTLLSGLPDAL